MTEQVGDEPQAQDTQHHQLQAAEHCQQDGQGKVFRTALRGKRREGRSRHQGSHGDRPDCKGHAGAECSVSQQWQEACVHPHVRGEPCEHGVGQALGYQQHRHHKPGNSVLDCLFAPVPPEPRGQPARPGPRHDAIRLSHASCLPF